MVEGAELAQTDWDTYRSERKDCSIDSLALIAAEPDAATSRSVQRGFDEGLIVAAAQNFTRSLVNEPGNVLTPTVLGARAKAMCEDAELKCEVYSSDKLQELKMEAFWAVAKGSAEPPALIVMTYEPDMTPAADAPVLGLVGKGITFDTGGISIKPADGMEKMKYDMAGAAAMIGAMHAIARLKPKVKVIARDLFGGEHAGWQGVQAGRCGDGDVGQDDRDRQYGRGRQAGAGRWTALCEDAGLHASDRCGDVDWRMRVALGVINAGLFSNDDATCAKFEAALAVSGEKYWRLPCTDDYRDHIKSEIADIMNTGKNRYGGAISAAMFLKEFVGDTPWVHLDIAGCAWNEEKKPGLLTGPAELRCARSLSGSAVTPVLPDGRPTRAAVTS